MVESSLRGTVEWRYHRRRVMTGCAIHEHPGNAGQTPCAFASCVARPSVCHGWLSSTKNELRPESQKRVKEMITKKLSLNWLNDREHNGVLTRVKARVTPVMGTSGWKKSRKVTGNRREISQYWAHTSLTVAIIVVTCSNQVSGYTKTYIGLRSFSVEAFVR